MPLKKIPLLYDFLFLQVLKLEIKKVYVLLHQTHKIPRFINCTYFLKYKFLLPGDDNSIGVRSAVRQSGFSNADIRSQFHQQLLNLDCLTKD